MESFHNQNDDFFMRQSQRPCSEAEQKSGTNAHNIHYAYVANIRRDKRNCGSGHFSQKRTHTRE